MPSAEQPSAVAQVFRTTELLEQILLLLDIPSLLKAQQVNRFFFDVIKDSIRIQKTAGFLPDEDAWFSAPLWPFAVSFHGLFAAHDGNHSSRASRLEGEPDNIAELALMTSGYDVGRSLGSRCRSLLVCQPPITSMTVAIICQNCHWKSDEDVIIPKRANFVTLGDVRDFYEREMDAHEEYCEEDGNMGYPVLMRKAHLWLFMTGRVNLRDDDPVTIRNKEARRLRETSRPSPGEEARPKEWALEWDEDALRREERILERQEETLRWRQEELQRNKEAVQVRRDALQRRKQAV